MSYIRDNAIDAEENSELMRRIREEFYQKKNYQNATEAESDMALLAIMMDNLVDNDDDDALNFTTPNGNNISMNGNAVGMDLFSEGPSDSPENLTAALEITLAAKAAFEDDSAHLGGTYSEEEMQIMAYAADLVGFTMENRPEDIVIPDEIKQKMDAQWQQMQIDLGMIDAPETVAENDLNREQDLSTAHNVDDPALTQAI